MTNVADNKAIGTRKKSAIRVSKGVKKVLKWIVIGLAIFFVMVCLRAYAATLQYENNTLTEENAYIQAEIDSMQSQIVEETKVTSIEKLATEKYDMVYPTPDNCITIKEKKKVADVDLSAKIRKRAYN